MESDSSKLLEAERLTSGKENAPGAIRTHGLRIRNPALYPPELRGREEYQLVTVIFFFSCVNLCLFVG